MLQGLCWAALPPDLLLSVFGLVELHDRVAASSVCQSWRSVALLPGLFDTVSFATHRDGSRRTELRRLLSLAAWAKRHAGATRSLAISARLPADTQPAGLKAAAATALAAAGSLRDLSLTSSRGFWAGEWLPRLRQLQHLKLCSKEGGLSLHGDLSALAQLTSLALDARHPVTLSDALRLPASIRSVELSCVRDTLPAALAQLAGLQRLAVRRSVVSEGVLLMDYECLSRLTGLTSLALEHQEEEAWLPPPELLHLTRLCHLSISGNDCSRWPLHGSDEAFSGMLERMAASLTSLDLSGCGLEELPAALLHPLPDGSDSDCDGDDSGGGGGSGHTGSPLLEPAGGGGGAALPAATMGAGGGAAFDVGAAAVRRGPRLLRLLAHGNQLEASALHGGHELLWLPPCVRELSLDWHVLVQLPIIRWPPRCATLALVGRDGAMHSLLSSVARLPTALPDLRRLLLEPAALDALFEARRSASGGAGWQLVGGRWRPPRLPGQAKPAAEQADVVQQLREAGVEVGELLHAEQLPVLLDQQAAPSPGGS